MAQEILLKRSSVPYTSETAAWSALDNHTFKKGEPIVAFYNKENNSVHGDTSIAAIYAIGTANDTGKYQAFASYEDFFAVWAQADLNAKAILELQQTLNAMWTLKDGVLYTTHTVVAEGDGVFGGDYSGGGGGGTGEGGSSTLAGLIDVKDNGAGSVAGSSGSAAAVGSLLAFNGTDWYAITKSELATAMKQPLIDEGIATENFVNVAIQNAKDARVDILVNDTIPAINKDIEDLEKAVGDIPVYTIAQIAVEDENVKEAYQLKSGNTNVGDIIKIYKDSALQEVYLGANTDTVNATTGVVTKNTATDAQSLNFIYQLADGKYSITKIDVTKFLTQSEFGNGLQVSSGKVSVKVDTTSQSNLSVSASGIKLSGVAQASDLSTLEGRTITAGKGLTGGGDLSDNRTINVASADDGITVNDDNIQLNTVNVLTSDSKTKPLSAAQGKQLQANITALGNKKITAGNGLSGDVTLSSGGTMEVNVDGSSIVITNNKLGVSVIDGGTF